MSKKPRPPRSKYSEGTACAYCGDVVPILEREHVFPESWYAPDTKPSEMMIVPACGPCNRFFGTTDNDARILVLTCEPSDSLTQTVQKQVVRSLDPSEANSGVDRGARRKRRSDLESWLCTVSETELKRAIWAVDQTKAKTQHRTPSGVITVGRPGMRIPPHYQPTIVGKWLRGSYYHVNNRALPMYVPWAWYSPTAAGDPRGLIQYCSQVMPLVFARPEFRVYGVTTITDALSSIWMFALWDKMIFFGVSGQLASKDMLQAIEQAATHGVDPRHRGER